MKKLGQYLLLGALGLVILGVVVSNEQEIARAASGMDVNAYSLHSLIISGLLLVLGILMEGKRVVVAAHFS